MYGDHTFGADIRQPYELSESDVFSSCPVNGVIAFTTPSVMDLYSATWADFNGAGQLPANIQRFTLSVENARDREDPIRCSNSDLCTIEYSRWLTPYIHDVVPNQVFLDQHVQFWINPNGIFAGTHPDGVEPIQWLGIGSALTDWEGLIDSSTRLNNYRLGTLNSLVGD
jgi:hypothetical protein